MLTALLAVVLMLGAQVGAAQDAPAAPVAAGPDAAALLAEFDKLQAECDAYSADFWKTLQPDADGNLQPTPEQFAKWPDKIYGMKFLELARRAGKTEAGCKAYVEALRMVREPPATRDEIVEALVGNFADSPALARAVPQLGGLRWSKGSAEAEALLRRVLAATTVDDVKAAATLELAQVLMDPVYVIGSEGGFTTTPRADVAPARALLSEVVERWPDTKYAKDAKGSLFDIDHLQVGMVAPDFESTDQDGKSFKLSDYRGKVVLLDFWGFW